MKNRKSIGLTLFIAVLFSMLSWGNSYGFSSFSNSHHKQNIIQKSAENSNNGLWGFFFEEDSLDETEDESLAEVQSFYPNEFNKFFAFNIEKVQLFYIKNFLYFSQPVSSYFILFRNLRL